MKNLTYYHGTSTLFMRSIKKYGLGGVNPTIKHKNLDLLAYLFGISKQNLTEKDGFGGLVRDTIEATVNQTKLKINDENGNSHHLNFKHKNTYISLSEYKALHYATAKGHFGSEILEKCVILYDLLKNNNIQYKIKDELNTYKLEELKNKNFTPVLLKLKKVKDDNLVQENDYEAEPFLKELKLKLPSMSEKEIFENFQYMNFYIKKPIPSKFIEFYLVDYRGNVEKGDFRYNLKRIF